MEAARQLVALHQGKLDNLCGLYSILNAVRLACWPSVDLNHARSRHLFNHGIAMLDKKGLLASVLRHGMTEKVWAWLCGELLRCLDRHTGTRLERSPILKGLKKADLAEAVAVIERHTRVGQPVLVRLLGCYNHYTVICGHREGRLLLFDSFGYRWIALSACELDYRRARARHRIVRTSAMVLRQIR